MKKTLRELAFSEIRDLVHRHVSIFTPEDMVSKVLGELKDAGRYEALVASNEKIGLISIRDLLDVDQPAQTKVDGIWRVIGPMSPSDRIIDASDVMIRHIIRALPVVEDGEAIGCISQADVMEALCDVPELSGIPAKELMRMPVVSLDAGEKVALARRMMLEKGFSHIPIVEHNQIVGMVTAENIVHTFITPISKTTTGDRVGERVARFPGAVSGIMDLNPLTLGPNASVLDVVCGLRAYKKSACVVADRRRKALGILTPKELMAPLLRFKAEKELPVYIIGLSDENFFERTVAEDKLRRVVQRNIKMHPHITEVSVRIKSQQKRGERTRYEVTARAMSAEEQILAKADGWDLLQVFDKLCDTLNKALRKSKHEPERIRSRRRSRFRR